MPRISQPPPSTVSTTRTDSSFESPRPATNAPAGQAQRAWGAGGAPKTRTPALGALEATLQTPASRPIGPAPVASTIAGVPVKSATTLQLTGLKAERELMNRTVDVSFGKLSQSQFDALKTEFGGKSNVRYDASREYNAIDFLPPMLQSLVNRDLDTGKQITIAGTEKIAEDMMMGDQVSIGATPNCHGTAWEAMRAYQGTQGAHVQLAYGDAQLVEAKYSDDFTTLATARPGEKLDTSKLQPGDVVTFNRHDASMGDMELLHSAVYVGGGLFFEKPDTESDEYSETPYRLVTLDQVTAPIADFLSEQPSMTARRPKANLPPPAEAFSAGSDDVGKLEQLLNKRGETVGRPLVTELIMGMGGGVRGMAFNAVLTKKLETDASGRGVLR